MGPNSSTHLPLRAVTSRLAGLLHTDGTRLQVRAEPWAGGGTGAEHLPRKTLWEAEMVRWELPGKCCLRLPLLLEPCSGTGAQPGCSDNGDKGRETPCLGPGHTPVQGCRLHSCCCSVSCAWHGAAPGCSLQFRWRSEMPPPQTAEHLLQADQGPRRGHSRRGHSRDPFTQVLWMKACSWPQAPGQDAHHPDTAHGPGRIPVVAVQLHHLSWG